jgi:hypothetical protein
MFYGSKGGGNNCFVGAEGDKSYLRLGSGKLSPVKEIGVDMGREFLYRSLRK